DGRVIPFQPCTAARDLLVHEAAALRGWSDVDGWKMLQRDGHVVTVRKAGDGFKYEHTIDGSQDAALVSPGDDLFTLLGALELRIATLPKK
ncbi:MAG TPA: hypothetical protein VF805_05495, partial [Anaeromyxobacteraceae bacterium]